MKNKDPFLGNYATYYGYRLEHEVDHRLLTLNPSWFNGKRVLDIGCNDGTFTLQLHTFYTPAYIKGLDIDPSLIRKAKNTLKQYLSIRVNEYPITCPKTYGYLVHDHHDIEFQCSDIVTEPINIHEKYDTILALSITKWIHLSKGDAGLKLFFRKCYQMLKRGGLFILEPQTWESYKNSVSQKNIKSSIELKPADFEFFLESIGFLPVDNMDNREKSRLGFKREIFLFRK
jgi:7SK snRNA methylphosphate capping enzyme